MVANLYARIGSGGKHFCFGTDTPTWCRVGDLSSWTIGPFSAELSAGYLFGRGAADMKGAIAAFTEAAARFLRRRGRDFGGSISLLITGDEEGPAVNGTVKMLKKLAERGETIDACVVGEPTSSRRFGDMMKIGRRGSMTVDMVVRGIQGHCRLSRAARQSDPPPVGDHRGAGARADRQGQHALPADLAAVHHQSTSATRRPTSRPGTVRVRFNTRFNDLWTSQTLLAHLKQRIERASAAVGGNGTIDYEKVEVSGESFYTPPGPLVAWWPARCATSSVSTASCRPPAAPPTRASSAATARCWSSGWSARPCTRSTRRAPSPTSRRWRGLRNRARPLLRRLRRCSARPKIARGIQGRDQDSAARRERAAALRQHARGLPALLPGDDPGGAVYASISRALCAPGRTPTRSRSCFAEACSFVVDWLLYPVIFYEVRAGAAGSIATRATSARSTGSTCRS
jgi:hypothetical protein